MTRSLKLATVVFVALVGGCATDDVDLDIDPACGDDAKCDGVSSSGFEIFQGADGRYYFHLVSGNGEIVMQSQGYTTKASAVNGVESVRTNGVNPSRYKLKQAANGEFYVNLTARNGAVIASTETYAQAFNAQRGMESTIALVSKAQRLRAAQGGARFQSFIGADHQAYFQLRGGNGEVMLSSEGYVNPYGAVEATKSVRENGKIASRFELLQASDGQYYFRLKAGNGEIIAHSETYSTKSNAQRAIDSIVKLLASELVADAKPATKPARTITSQTALTQALDALGEVATGGAELSYFGYAEQAARAAGSQCTTMSAAQAATRLSQTAEEIMASGDAGLRPDLTMQTIAAGQAQLVTLLGTDTYDVCTLEVTGAQTSVSDLFVLSQRADGPHLVFQLGLQN